MGNFSGRLRRSAASFAAALWAATLFFSASSGAANQGAFQALGIYGQHIYVNPRERGVIVVWGAPCPNPPARRSLPMKTSLRP